MTTVRVATYDLLRALGMTTIFGNPGSTEETFLRDFPADFTYVLGLQEAAVVGVADGFAQAARRAAFVNLHTAPGVGNAMGALATAWHNRAPLVVTAGQQVRTMLALEPWLVNREAIELPKPYVKWSYEPPRAQDVPAAIERAYHTALQAPSGPVFVSIPMDDWDAPAEAHTPRQVSHRTAPDPAALERIADALRQSRRPLIVAGAGIDRSDAWDAAITLAERTRAAVWAAPASERAGFPEDHPLFQGILPPAIAPLAERLAGHDLVLVLGAPVFRYYPYVPGPKLPDGTRLVHLTDDPDEAARAPVGTALVGDVGLAIERLAALVPPSDRAAPPPRSRPAPPSPGAPMSPAFVMHALAAALPAGAVVVNEAASSVRALREQVRTTRSGGYYSTASGGLGFGMPAAVGIQLAQPERPVVCVIGDGAAMYSIQALWTAARHETPVVFVVVNNGEYAILKAFAAFERVGDRVPGLDLPGLDVVQIARGFGCAASRVDRAEELAEALGTAFRTARQDRHPVLVDVVVDRAVPPLL